MTHQSSKFKFTLTFIFLFKLNTIICQKKVNFEKCCADNEGFIIKNSSNNVYLNCETILQDYILPLRYNEIQNATAEMCADKIIDDFSGTVYEVPINERNNSTHMKIAQIPTIYQCCPDKMSFDLIKKSCNFDNDSRDKLIQDSDANIYNLMYGHPTCNKVYMEDVFQGNFTIKNGELLISNKVFKNGTYCLDLRKSRTEVIVISCGVLGDGIKKTCKENTCIRKCCSPGFVYKFGAKRKFECLPSWNTTFNPPFYANKTIENKKILLLHAPNCRHGKYLKSMPKESTLLSNGSIQTSKNVYDPYIEKTCVELFDTKVLNGYYTVICFSPPKKDLVNFFHLSGLIISIVFLGLTLIIYFFLPDLQNLHGRTVMSNTTSLFAAYIFLALIKVPLTEYSNSICLILGYGVFFTFLSAFSWLNVMCFDIWWTFGAVQVRGLTKNKDLKKFLLYCLYAYGLPSCITLIALIIDFQTKVPDYYKPKIGHKTCWFDLMDGPTIEYTIYFMIPVAVLIVSNTIFFVLTVRYCLKIRNDIQKMQHADLPKKTRFLADKATLIMNIKLFVVMGITWAFEIISVYIKEPFYLWMIFDTINVLQGLWIFFIFVLKENVWKAIKKKLGYSVVRESSQTQTTTLSAKLSNASTSSIVRNNCNERPESKELIQNLKNNFGK